MVTIANLTDLAPANLGDMVIDDAGRACIGCQAFSGGVIVHLDPDDSATVVTEDLDFPNGMVITPDRKTLIVAESTGRRLSAFTIGDDDGLRDRRIFADGLDGPPDGIALDAEGGVWTAMTLAHQVEWIIASGRRRDRPHRHGRPCCRRLRTGRPAAPHAVSAVEHRRVSPAPGRHPALPAGRGDGWHSRRRPALNAPRGR